jgi:hypothetical protein
MVKSKSNQLSPLSPANAPANAAEGSGAFARRAQSSSRGALKNFRDRNYFYFGAHLSNKNQSNLFAKTIRGLESMRKQYFRLLESHRYHG